MDRQRELELAGKVAIITGASRGIGKQTAMALARRGVNLVLTARTVERLGFTVALAGGATVKAAAELAGMGERTAYRRRADPDFRRRVDEFRAESVDRAIGHLSAAAADAAVTLRNTLNKADSPALQLRAAEAILDRLGLGAGDCPRCRRRGEAEADEEAVAEERVASKQKVEDLPYFDVVEAANEAVGINQAQHLLLVILSSTRGIGDIGSRIKADEGPADGIKRTRRKTRSDGVQVIARDRQGSGRIYKQ